MYKGANTYNINSCETIEVFYNLRTDLDKLNYAVEITKIIRGKGGNMLKRIGQSARIDMENNFGTKVNLKTWVKVKEDWQDDSSIVKKFKLQ